MKYLKMLLLIVAIVVLPLSASANSWSRWGVGFAGGGGSNGSYGGVRVGFSGGSSSSSTHYRAGAVRVGRPVHYPSYGYGRPYPAHRVYRPVNRYYGAPYPTYRYNYNQAPVVVQPVVTQPVVYNSYPNNHVSPRIFPTTKVVVVNQRPASSVEKTIVDGVDTYTFSSPQKAKRVTSQYVPPQPEANSDVYIKEKRKMEMAEMDSLLHRAKMRTLENRIEYQIESMDYERQQNSNSRN